MSAILDQVQALVDFAVDHFGGLDIMFNNAGIGSPLKRFLPDDLEDFSRIMSVNLFGVIAGAQHPARYMRHTAAAASSTTRPSQRSTQAPA